MSLNLNIPKFKLPALVARVGNRLPQWPHALTLAAGLNAAAKMKLLPQDSLELLEGRSFLVEVLDTGGRACFTYRDGLFRPLLSAPSAPDLSFRANLSAFMQMLARQEAQKRKAGVRDLFVRGRGDSRRPAGAPG